MSTLPPRPNPEPGVRKPRLTIDSDGRAHTKVVGTLGPASEPLVGELIDAGLSVARINFSHEDADAHRRRVDLVRTLAAERGAAVGILADVQGPKLRLGTFQGGWLELSEGDTYVLCECPGEEYARQGEIPVRVEGLVDALESGHRVFLADGVVELEVGPKEGRGYRATVVRGGLIGDRKGVHLPDSDLRIDLPTPKDVQDIALARELGVDMIGVSFVSSGEDLLKVRSLAPEPQIVAKIERAAALQNLPGIFQASDGIMVARGDLGVEVELEQLPMVQKALIQEALRHGRFTITATEMLESMVDTSRPTRAEVADVANAILDGTDAVMLSAETAVGRYPVEAVSTMVRVALAVEQSQRYHDLPKISFRADEPTVPNATAMAAAEVAQALELSKIISFTESGDTVRLLSRYRPGAPIIALTPNPQTMSAMAILAHVQPVLIPRQENLETMLRNACEMLLERRLVRVDDWVVFTVGVPTGRPRTTNLMMVHQMGQELHLR